jgi:peptidoglycan biosynthesis protein MviN/MurJ (putative lipid II flippase)
MAWRIVRGMAVILFFGAFLRLGGLIINMLVGQIYGPGPINDTYNAVFSIIISTFLFSSALKIFAPAFMPMFADLRAKSGDFEGAVSFLRGLLDASPDGATVDSVSGRPRLVKVTSPPPGTGTRSTGSV